MARSARSGAAGDPPVRRLPESRRGTRAKVPYVVVLQSHLFEALPTVVIAPLMRLEQSARNSKVLVEVEFAGESLVVNAAFLGNIEHRMLGRSRGSLAAYEDDIRRAIDRLFTGF